MIHWIIDRSQKSRFIVVVVAAVVMFFGISQLRTVPVEILPEFDPPYVEIQTEALGLSATELEDMITVTMEQDMLNSVAWLKEIRSETIPGLSSIRLTFEPGTDPIRARQMVQEQLLQAHALPSVATAPVMLQPLSSTARVMKIGLSSKKLSLIDLSVLARWTIQPRLMGVAGVANVSIFGQRKRQVQVQVDPERLREKGVTLQQIIETAGNATWVTPLSFLNASAPGAGGFIDTPNQRLAVRHFSPIRTPQDLARVPVDGTDLVLGDVATLVEQHQPLIGDAIVNDGSSLLLVVERFPGASTRDVTRGVERALDALKAGLADVDIDSQIYRPATFIAQAIDNLGSVLLISGVLVLLALGAFLFEWRSALIGTVAIATSLAAAVLVLALSGVTFNMLIVAGLILALVAIVDDALVNAENIKRRLDRDRRADAGKPVMAIIGEAVFEMRTAIAYGTAVIVLAAAPALFMAGVEGAFFQPFAISFLVALGASIVVALTVTPALSVFLFRDAAPVERDSPIARSLRGFYDAVLSRTVKRSAGALVTVAVIVAAGAVAWPMLERTLLPAFKETNLLVRWNATPGTSRPEMSRIVGRATAELRGLPGITNVGAHVGRAVLSDQASNVNSGEIWLRIDPAADYDATLATVRATVQGYPGFALETMTYLDQKTRAARANNADSLVVRVYGHEFDVLRQKAEDVKQAISSVDGLADLRIDGLIEEPQVEIRVKLDAAERHGIKPGDVRRAAATLVSGLEVGSLFENQKVFGVVVWGVPKVRHSLSSIRDLLIDTPEGGHVRLGEVAEVAIKPTPTVIRRESVSRYMDVIAAVDGRSLDAIFDDVEDRLGGVAFPQEYRAEIVGASAEALGERMRMLEIGIAAAIGIVLVLQACFGSWLMAALTFVSLVAALAGGLLAALLGGAALTIGSLIGLVGVFGIAARNCLSLIGRYHQLERDEGETVGVELVRRGTRERFAPIVMTGAMIALAFVPMALFGSVAGLEIIQPMAVVILGGLVTSTIVTLFVVPALYAKFGSSPEPELGERAPAPALGAAE